MANANRIIKALNAQKEKNKYSIVLSIFAFFIFISLLFKNFGLYPLVFADEYTYSTVSRLLPRSDATIPSYLYLMIYRFTNVCGSGFLDCARVLYTLFFISAMPFIYRTARQVCKRNVASIVALLALLGPINSYTSYYMPEALYFFSFWFFTWFILRLDNMSNISSWCIAGILLGFSSLVKPHTLFFLPAIVAYILYVNRSIEGKWILHAFKKTCICIASVFFIKFLISYLYAGKAGIIMFGHLYSPVALAAISNALNFQNLIKLLSMSIISIKGHILAICLVFGLPIASAIYSSVNPIISKKIELKADQKISFYTLIVLVNLILIVGLFTASVMNNSPYETITRLHMRYYNFTFPLLFVIAASQLSSKSATNICIWKIIIAFPIGTVILYAIYTYLASYIPNAIDNPELHGFLINPMIFYSLSGISFLALALWTYSARIGAKIFVYLFMPIFITFSTFYTNREIIMERHVPDVFDTAGIIVKKYLPTEDISKLLIISSDPRCFRSLFYLDNSKASLTMIPKGAIYDLAKLPANKEWILVIGNDLLPKGTFYQLPMNDFTLARVNNPYTIDFKKPIWPGVISNTQGLSVTEPWGTWSSSNKVVLKFSAALPEKFTVHLLAQAFGTNIDKEFIFYIGDNLKKFTLTAVPKEITFNINNPKKLRTIKINIPSPISPKELAISSDDRTLGIGLINLKITPLSEDFESA